MRMLARATHWGRRRNRSQRAAQLKPKPATVIAKLLGYLNRSVDV